MHPDDVNIVSHPEGRQSGNIPLSVEYRIRRADGVVVWVARRAEFVKDRSSSPHRMLGTVQDISERKRIEARQQVLNHELSHRLKNTLAMVQAIARQTLTSAADKQALQAFDQRIVALSRAHEVLLQASWASADLRTVLEQVLGIHSDPTRFFIKGPDVRMGDKAALSLSLLVHELATNAVKHGSLSVPGGGAEVTWHKKGHGARIAVEGVRRPGRQRTKADRSR